MIYASMCCRYNGFDRTKYLAQLNRCCTSKRLSAVAERRWKQARHNVPDADGKSEMKPSRMVRGNPASLQDA